MKEIIKHKLADFIPASVIDETKAHKIVFWSLTLACDDEVKTQSYFASEALAVNKLGLQWDRKNTSSLVTNIEPIRVSGSDGNEHYCFTYTINGKDKEYGVCKEYLTVN